MSYVMRSQYGRVQYYGFAIGPNKDVRVGNWHTWKSATLGWRGEIMLYTDWSCGRTYTWNYWGLTERSVRNQMARALRKLRKQDQTYRASVRRMR